MKQKYVKPEVELIEFELTEAIAANCSTTVYNHGQGCSLKDEFDIWGPTAFTADNSCGTVLDGYCYYPSANIIFGS